MITNRNCAVAEDVWDGHGEAQRNILVTTNARVNALVSSVITSSMLSPFLSEVVADSDSARICQLDPYSLHAFYNGYINDMRLARVGNDADLAIPFKIGQLHLRRVRLVGLQTQRGCQIIGCNARRRIQPLI